MDSPETAFANGSPMLPPHRAQPRLYAGFWRRAVALLVDAVVFSAIHWTVV
jgi:hypothetical protein